MNYFNKILILFAVLSALTLESWANDNLVQFQFPGQALQTNYQATCGFPGLTLPKVYAIYAAGAYSGRETHFQIDQSGHQATQIDVAVNSKSKPVVLMLGAYEPTIWNIAWSKGTNILAVLVGGYHRQVVAGLPKNTPLLIISYSNESPCGYFYVSPDELAQLNPISRRIFGRQVDMVFLAQKGMVVIGDPLYGDSRLVTSKDTPPDSFFDPNAPLAGEAGLEDALQKGLLRKATAQDAEAWVDALINANPKPDIPPIAGKGILRPERPRLYNAYVVLKPFVYPAGLYGAHLATFFIPIGVPKPKGNPGHSAVYDFNTLQCYGCMD
jgi:hypothetical protein